MMNYDTVFGLDMENSQPENQPEQKTESPTEQPIEQPKEELKEPTEQQTSCLLIPVGIPIPKIIKTEIEMPFTEKTVYSEEYKELLAQIDIMFAYIGRRLAEIPELKESGAKRTMTYQTMVKCLAVECQITETQAIAALERVKFQVMYATENERALKEYQKQMAKEMAERSSAYTQ